MSREAYRVNVSTTMPVEIQRQEGTVHGDIQEVTVLDSIQCAGGVLRETPRFKRQRARKKEVSRGWQTRSVHKYINAVCFEAIQSLGLVQGY